MIERVEKALSDHWMKVEATPYHPDKPREWAGFAAVAIAAMREPTPEMLLAGDAEFRFESVSEIPAMWRAMIDKALKE